MMPSNDWVVRIKSRVFKTAQAHRTRCTEWGSSVLFVIEMKGHLPIMTPSRSPRNTKAPPTFELDLRGTMKRLKLFRLAFPKKQRNTISITLTGLSLALVYEIKKDDELSRVGMEMDQSITIGSSTAFGPPKNLCFFFFK